MVRIEYINGTEDTIETVKNNQYMGYFRYDNEMQCFIVYDNEDDRNCMMIPREFVKSIRHIEV